jgi:hypothetical protein
LEQGSVGQPGHELQHLIGRDLLVAADGFGGLQAPGASEDRQPRQQQPFGLGEQFVAPVDRRPKGLLTPSCRA